MFLMVDLDLILNGFNAVLMLSVAGPTIYMTSRIRVQPVRTFATILALFITVHGLYHLVDVLSGVTSVELLEDLADGFLAPLSYALLLVLAVYFERKGG